MFERKLDEARSPELENYTDEFWAFMAGYSTRHGAFLTTAERAHVAKQYDCWVKAGKP